jgi:carboxyl-terminal processing protease
MADNIQGLIIDLRGNHGGDSALPPKLLGHFVEFETFYRDLAYRAASGGYGVRMDERMTIELAKPLYKGPIVVLVDYKTFGAAESMAYALRQLSRTRVVGFSASQGTADVPTADIVMPGSYRISYPIARAVDQRGKVIITSNGEGVGGVQPDVLVPLNQKNATDFYVKKIDVVMIEAVRVLQQGI